MDSPSEHADSNLEFPDISDDFVNPPGFFPSREELEDYVRHVAGRRNITLWVRSSTPSEKTKAKYVKFLCSFGQEPRRRKSCTERQTRTSKTGCPFCLMGREWVAGAGPWYIDVKRGRHNHAFPMYKEGSRLGKITAEQYAVIKEQEKVNLTPAGMLAYQKSTGHFNATTKKQIYNSVARIRSENREGRSPLENFLHNLAHRGYKLKCRTKKESTEIGDIVFSHPGSFAMVNSYPQVMMVDCTYNTNRYDMPFLEAVG